MATLTIKPTAAGNDVQIKSGDGNTTHATFGDTNNISMSTGSIASAVTGTLGSGIVFPAGHIIQIVSYIDTDDQYLTSASTNTFASFPTPFKIGITPHNTGGTATDNKILVMMTFSYGFETGTAHFRIYRDSTAMAIGTNVQANQLGDTLSDRNASTQYTLYVSNRSITHLDAPAIPSSPIEIVYELKGTLGSSYADNLYLNRSDSDSNSDYASRPVSTITLLEVVV